MRVLRWLCLICLLLSTSCLTSCRSLAQVPPDQAVQLAIAQQLSHTQQAIAQDLGLLDMRQGDRVNPNFKIRKITVDSREKISDLESAKRHNIQDVYRVRGTFEANLIDSIGQPPAHSPFDLYLGTTPAETNGPETWFLLD